MDYYIAMGTVKGLRNHNGKTYKKTFLSEQIVHKIVTVQTFDKIVTNIFTSYNFMTFCL